MENIRLFQTKSEFNNSEKTYPQISYVEENNKINVGKVSDTLSNGIYVYEADGTFTPQSIWSSSEYINHTDAIGIAVVKGEFKFVIAKEDAAPSTVVWGTDGKAIDGVMMTSDKATALADNSGISNTDKIIAQDKPACVAAIKCREYIFPNGKKGYLGTFGEWNIVHDNRKLINLVMPKIGGSESISDAYWTSTQFDTENAWFVNNYPYAFIGSAIKNSKYSCRAFCSF